MLKAEILRSEADVMLIRQEDSPGLRCLFVDCRSAAAKSPSYCRPRSNQEWPRDTYSSSASPCGLSLFDGMTLPGNGDPVSGSVIVFGVLKNWLGPSNSLKSPRRMAASELSAAAALPCGTWSIPG